MRCRSILVLSGVCAIVALGAEDADKFGTRKRSASSKPGPRGAPYLVPLEAPAHYSQRDPLYRLNSTDLEPADNALDRRPLYRTAPYHRPQPHYYEQPEPIIEIIIKESNESLPVPATPPTPPPPPPTKEPVHVFYVKYKKNPNPGKDGGGDVIYEPPVPALTPGGVIVDPPPTPPPYPGPTATPAPPPPSTTLRTVIRPDSEIYHGTGLRVTFGSPELRSARRELDEAGAPEPELLYGPEPPSLSHQFKRQQPFDPLRYRYDVPSTPDYTPFAPRGPEPAYSDPVPHRQLPPALDAQIPTRRPEYFPQRGADYRQKPIASHKAPFVELPRNHKLVPPTPAQIEQYQRQKQQLHRENLRQQALRQQQFNSGQFDRAPADSQRQPPAYDPVRPAHLQPSFSARPYEAGPSAAPTTGGGPLRPQHYRTQSQQHHYRPPAQYTTPQQYRPSQVPDPQTTPAPPRAFSPFGTPAPPLNNAASGSRASVPPRGVYVPGTDGSDAARAGQSFDGGQIIKSISQSEEHELHRVAPTEGFAGGSEAARIREAFGVGASPAYPATSRNPITRRPVYAAPSTSPDPTTVRPASSTTTESTTTEETTKAEEPSEEDKAKSAANLAALPDEVPDDLREQLLSSGILGNADIQILDYDKVGDIPIESLPPEALENFYGAGSAPVPAVVRPDGAAPPRKGAVEMKVVRYDPSTEEGREVPDTYVREDATRLDPVVLNDSRYNRYLPLKVSGNRFPIPDAPQLKGRIVNSVVVLAPVDYDFVEAPPAGEEDRSGKAVQVQGVRFIAGEPLKNLVKEPTLENYNKWLEKERATPADRQSVVLLVTNGTRNDGPADGTEIFMYDVGTRNVSKLRGELSAAFVEVAESNSQSRDLEGLSNGGADEEPAAAASEPLLARIRLRPDPDSGFRERIGGPDLDASASEPEHSDPISSDPVVISSGYSKLAANALSSV